MAKVFLDAGHGGKDPGAVGQGLQEKDIALSVTLKIGQVLKDHGVSVYYARTTDVFLELSDRARMANNLNTDLFISIHCNAFNGSAKGVETYSYPGSTTGARLASSIQNSIIADKVYTLNRGTKTANFAVLRETNMNAALVETAFIDNAEDANILRNRQDDLAKAISKGILSYLGIPYKETPSKLYRVQVGAYSVRANADNLVNELKSKGYDAFVVLINGLYKVQVGAYSVKDNADRLVNELKSKGYDAFVVYY
ncbi:N-acetylmuramoyl-L-alanine amidase [Gottschalkia purinilytica]|uniref:N-acetylmuramoyl-L-alanine amidase n=1 Tax=Gottschalkia purinilytica TaxID=1503 RepID=A0A0L0WEY4_GOTPU|nr:N-acetylmuramoyl-L-alanine amidase [Gottschalkia purinilytica]KNF10048.1 N-acetylmuramoyl-L-alanine amidase [Gottschalkia purinilytica]